MSTFAPLQSAEPEDQAFSANSIMQMIVEWVCRGLSNDWDGELGASPGLAGVGQAEESGDQVLFGGVPTRPSSASTTGRSTFDVSFGIDIHAAVYDRTAGLTSTAVVSKMTHSFAHGSMSSVSQVASRHHYKTRSAS